MGFSDKIHNKPVFLEFVPASLFGNPDQRGGNNSHCASVAC
jgi:hypothetical protein